MRARRTRVVAYGNFACIAKLRGRIRISTAVFVRIEYSCGCSQCILEIIYFTVDKML